MKRIFLLSFSLIMAVSLVSGFVLSRGSKHMTINVHAKDLPNEGLTLLLPSQPSFEARFTEQMKGESTSAIDALKPYSVFLENRSQQAVVAYMIQWCFTRTDGKSHCYRKAVSAPRALMEGEDLSADEEARSGKIKSNSAVLLSLISANRGGQFRVPVPSTQDETERMKQGVKPDSDDLQRRTTLELAKYTDVTVSIDGAFFEDGTFVGDDTSGFFAQVKAQVDAKQDLLGELAAESRNPSKSREEVFAYVEANANQQAIDLNPKSTPEDHYRYYRKFYAQQILRTRKRLGDEKGLAVALRPTKRAWRMLAKRKGGEQR